MREKDARFAPPREHRKDAPVANGFVHQFRSDGAIDAAADGTYNPTSIAAYFADTSNFFPYKLLLTTTMTVSAHIPNTGPAYRCTHHSPVILAAADIVYEPGDDLLTARRVRHLRMKLNTVNRLRVMRNGSIRCGLRMADDMKIWRRSRELIAMRHPHLHSGNPTVRVSGGWIANRRVPRRTSISSPSPSNRASTVDPLLPDLLIWMRAKPYSRCSHFATVPLRFHASSWAEVTSRYYIRVQVLLVMHTCRP